MKIETVEVDLDDLSLYYKNPRIGNVDVIAESLDTTGQYRAIVVNRGTKTGRAMEVLAGNHTVKAARSLKWKRILAHIVDVGEQEAAKIVLVDNRSSDLGEIDSAVLIDVASSLDDLIGTGFTQEDMDLLIPGDDRELLIGEDDLPEDGQARAAKGDIWRLGEHIVVCGDSTEEKTFDALLDGEVVDCIWTDPPYGVDYVGKTKKKLTIQNDGEEGLGALLHDVFSNLFSRVRQGAPMYVAYPARGRVTFETTITATGFDVRQELMWVKNTFAMSMGDYHYQHEGVLYGFKPTSSSGRLGRGGSQWYGDNKQATIFEAAEALIAKFEDIGDDRVLLVDLDALKDAIQSAFTSSTVFYHDKPAVSAQHPTMKPVGLITDMLRNSARKNETVIDPFGGSGSTLIAAEILGLRARLIEMDPKFVDVIISRWEEATGGVAERIGQV